MELWGKSDVFSRWINAFCAGLFLLFAFAAFRFSNEIWTIYSVFVALYLAYRCARYALTGEGNINRDAS